VEPRGDPVLTAAGIRRSFGATQALRGVDLTLRAGEVHALLGENGAGKSTLVKIMVGAIAPDDGTLRLRDAELPLRSVSDALAHGIVPIYQELSLMPHLSVGENLASFDIAAGRALAPVSRSGWVDTARVVLAELGLDIDHRTPVRELSLAECQLVEVARAVARDCAVLVLDEPTACLSRPEAQRLFGVVRKLRGQGRAILFISHRMDEVAEIADRVTVLRDGLVAVEDQPVAGVSQAGLVEAMLGRAVRAERLELAPVRDEVVLEARNLGCSSAFRDVTLALRAGEILGIVGLVGSGVEELGSALAGHLAPSAGSIDIGALPPGHGRVAFLARGVGYLPPDRKTEGIFPTLDVLRNATASALAEVAPRGWLEPRRERVGILDRLRSLGVRPADPESPITVLSGGNQQKVLMARVLVGRRSRVIVAVEPTRGVDIGARREIHEALARAAADGMAVVAVSSDLDEILAISHRVLVMRAGSVVAEVPGTSEPAAVLGHLTGAA
jgi:ABC-type sugar transport system ATPase subunit